jgi:methionyl-tRNA formyltransferase
MLVHGLQERVFVPPLQDVGVSTIDDERINPSGYGIKNASKITPDERKISLSAWGGHRIYRHYRALGRLWADVWINARTRKRLIFEDITLVDESEQLWTESFKSICHETSTENQEENETYMRPRFIVAGKTMDTWHPVLYIGDGDGIVLNTSDTAIRVRSITVEGQSKKTAFKALHSLHFESAWRLKSEEHEAHKLSVEPLDGI